VPFLDAGDMLHGAPLPGWRGSFFHSANMTFALWDIAEGAADLHEHHHEQEEVWNIAEGEVIVIVAGEERRLGPGMAAVVPPNTPHSVKCIGPCRVVVTDFPVRDQLPGVPRD
jgi:mannose-6-phosphate isomerase-like protein (cupin superfamily)